jgi:hypothetical protein
LGTEQASGIRVLQSVVVTAKGRADVHRSSSAPPPPIGWLRSLVCSPVGPASAAGLSAAEVSPPPDDLGDPLAFQYCDLMAQGKDLG